MRGDLLRETSVRPLRAIHDSRLVRPGDLFVALSGKNTDGHRHLEEVFTRGACAALVSQADSLPDTAQNLIVVPNVTAALQTLAAAWRDALSATFIGITGSNGKTTVKALLGHLLAQHTPTYVAPRNYNTEIGLPIALLAMPPDASIGVFELGAEAPGDIRLLSRLLNPQLGIITTVGPSHLDDLKTIDAVAREKWSLIESLPSTSSAIVNADSPELRERLGDAPVPITATGFHHGQLRGRLGRMTPSLEIRIESENITLCSALMGEHNASNVLLAAAAARELGMPWSAISAALPTFQPISHRLQPLRTPTSVVLDDSYNANPASTEAALRVLAAYGDESVTRVFVFGEMHGLGPDAPRYHDEVVQIAHSLFIDKILPVGDLAVAACRRVDVKAETEISIILTREEILSFLRDQSNAVILIKGSRALGLERLVAALIEAPSRAS